jgi:uncharacterized delta-60 repeat protein
MFNQFRSRIVIGLLFFSFALPAIASAFNGSLDESFNAADFLTSDDVFINSTAIQSDGKILISGNFTEVGGKVRNRLARFNSDGSLDISFSDLDITGEVTSIVIQTDGKILIAGGFTRVGDATRGAIARINTDGSLDNGFSPNANSVINAIAIQGDGRIVVGGNFTRIAGRFRHGLARLNTDGTLDVAFDPNSGANGQIRAIDIQADNKIIIGGSFTKVNTYFNTTAGFERKRLARLNANGSVDTNFNIDVSNVVRAIAIQSDGKILIGGNFSLVGGVERIGAARLNADGTLQVTFNPSLDGAIYSIAIQNDGKALIGGRLNMVGDSQRRNLARLNLDDTLDAAFNSNSVIEATPSMLYSISIQSDGNIIIGGSFFTLGSSAVDRIVRLSSDGSLDPSFEIGALLTSDGVQISTMVAQGDDKILVGGNFSTVGGFKRDRLARLNADGSLDLSFNAGELLTLDNRNFYDINVSALAIQNDGRAFVAIGRKYDPTLGRGVGSLVRLDTDGTRDAAFSDQPITVNSIVIQADGKVLIGGDFLRINSVDQKHVARFNADGTLDAAFGTNANIGSSSNGKINAIAVQDSDSVLIGGVFPTAGGNIRKNVARLHADGTLDLTFSNPNVTGEVRHLAIQESQKILVTGGFRAIIDREVRDDLVRLNTDGVFDATFNTNSIGTVKAISVQSDNTILVNGFLREISADLRSARTERLHVDGTLDENFNSNISGLITSFARQKDGKLLVAGANVSLSGSEREWITRLEDMPPVIDELCIPIKAKNGALAFVCL